MTDQLMFKLYIIGKTSSSLLAVENLEKMFEGGFLGDNFQWEVIDLLENPQIASEKRILAAPVVIRESPEPVQMLVGDFSDFQKVKQFFGLGFDYYREHLIKELSFLPDIRRN